MPTFYELENEELENKQKRWLTMVGTFLMIGFACSLRGNEGFMVEAQGLQEYISQGKERRQDSHVVIPILGRYKNEDNENWHLMLVVSVTESGFEVRKWVERLVDLLKQERKTVGPAFCQENGKVISSMEMDSEFLKQLEVVQKERPDLIKGSIDVHEFYSIFRSLRKGSTARAMDQGISKETIDLHNRWRTSESSGGQRSRRSMRDYYADLRLMLHLRLSYTKVL
jgi:hypothetical protein